MPDSNGNWTWQEWMAYQEAQQQRAAAQAAPGLQRAQQAQERTFQTNLSESRAERAQRLQIANNQLKAQREQIAVSRGTAEANKWYQEQQVRLAEEEAQRQGFQFQQTHLLEQQKLGANTGLGLMQLRASLKGPGEWSQFLDAGEGFDAIQPASGFLSSIAAGKTPAVMDAAFGAQPITSTLAGLATPTVDQQRQRLDADQALAAKIAGNVGKVAPGALDVGTIGQDRLDYLLGLAGQKGFSAQTLMDAYERNKPGQGNAFAY